LAIVVAILGVIAAIAIPRYSDMVERVRAATEVVKSIQLKVDEVAQIEGGFPAALKDDWFTGGRPENPLYSGRKRSIQTVNSPGETDPSVKVSDGSIPVFWYNAANGVVRARVPSQKRAEETAALCASVNGLAVPVVPAVPGGQSVMDSDADELLDWGDRESYR
jgi:type II secretory pathway pseudopilin PulG